MLLALTSLTHAQITVRGQIGSIDRRLSDGGAVERQAGIVAGGGVTYSLSRISITALALGGRLSAKTNATPDVDYARLETGAEISAASWLVLCGGAEISVFVSPGSAQRWFLPRVGLELRPPFSNLPAYAFVRGTAIVGASTNSATAPGTSAEFHAGLRGRWSRLQLFAEYELQRLGFAVDREEQVGGVWFGAAISL
jgi:hypothetical protein